MLLFIKRGLPFNTLARCVAKQALLRLKPREIHKDTEIKRSFCVLQYILYNAVNRMFDTALVNMMCVGGREGKGFT